MGIIISDHTAMSQLDLHYSRKRCNDATDRSAKSTIDILLDYQAKIATSSIRLQIEQCDIYMAVKQRYVNTRTLLQP